MAVPIEYFTEELKNMQLCQIEGKVTDFWRTDRPNGKCFDEGIVEINGKILGQIYTTDHYCDADTMFDHFKSYKIFWENFHKILAEENTGKIIQIREKLYLPKEIDAEKIPFCDVEKFPREKFEKMIEHIEHDNMLWLKECCPTNGIYFDEMENFSVTENIWPSPMKWDFQIFVENNFSGIIWIIGFVMSILIILGIIKISIEKIFKKKS